VPHRFPYLDSPLPLAFAHRGGAAHGLENTMTAFARAVDLGYRYLETDVHVTADGVPVAFHDRTLGRVSDRGGAIGTLTWSQVRDVRIGDTERVPLLEDVLGTWPEVRVNVDVKSDAAVDPLVEVVRRTGTLDRVCVGSFSDRRLVRVRRALGPRLCTSMGPREVLGLRVAAWRRPGGRSPAGGPAAGSLPGAAGSSGSEAAAALPESSAVPCAQVPVRVGVVRVVDARLVDVAHRLGLQVHVWTIDDPDLMHRLLDLGVDGIMTDRIDVLRDVYLSRGVWPA